MAFNPEDYLKPGSKTSVERVAYNVAINSVAGNPQSSLGVAKDLSLRIVTEGASLTGASSLVSEQVEAINKSVSEMYYALAGLDVSRTSGAKLSNLRRSSANINQTQIENIHPATKISRARRADRVDITTVI